MDNKKQNKISAIVFSFDFWLEAVWLGAIFVIPLIFSWWSGTYNMFELPKAVFFCFFTEILAVLFLAKIFKQNKFSGRANWKIICFFGILALAMVLAVLNSFDPARSFWGSFERQQGLFLFIHLFLWFFILAGSIKNFRQIKRIIGVAIISSFLVSLYGAAQKFGWDFWEWKEVISGSGRIFSSLGQPNFLGYYLILVIPLTVYAFFFLARRLVSRFVLLLVFVFQIFCVATTLSRGAWLGLAAEGVIFIFFLFLFWKKRSAGWRKEQITSMAIFMLAGFLFLVSVFISSDGILSERVKSLANFNSGSVKMRVFYWQAAVEEMKEMGAREMLFGYGPENTDQVFVKYYRPEWGVYEEADSFPDRAHNGIFDTIFNLGLVGLALLIVFYIYLFLALVKTAIANNQNSPAYFWLAGAVISALGGHFIAVLFGFPTVVSLVYIFTLLAISFWLLSRARPEFKVCLDFFTVYSKILIFVFFLILVGIFSWIYLARPMMADYYYGRVIKEASGSGRCLPIINNLNQVIFFQPDNVFYQNKYIYYHLNCLRDKNLTAVNEEIKYNIESVLSSAAPIRDYRLKFQQAHAYSLFGFFFNPDYYQRADELYQELLAINPYFLNIHSDYGRMKLWQQDYEAAIEILQAGLAVAPDLTDSAMNFEHQMDVRERLFILYNALGQAYFFKKEYDEAIVYFQQALMMDPFSADIYKKIGDCYHKSGLKKEANFHYEKVLLLGGVLE